MKANKSIVLKKELKRAFDIAVERKREEVRKVESAQLKERDVGYKMKVYTTPVFDMSKLPAALEYIISVHFGVKHVISSDVWNVINEEIATHDFRGGK